MTKNQILNHWESAILNKFGMERRKIEQSVFQLASGNTIIIKYSKPRKNKPYFFGVSKLKIERLLSEKLFILLILVCGTKTEPDVIVLPATYLLKFLDNIETAKDGDWKIHITKYDADFKISVTGKQEKVSQYLNGFDLIISESAISNQQGAKYNYSTIGQDAFAQEILDGDKYYEGAIKQIRINTYKRDLAARNKCIDHYGLSCHICGFNFENKYGYIGKRFIHVHHLKPLSEIGYEYELDPIQDLRPVCPNCHAMIHRRRPPYSIEEILKVLNPS